ncbi:MAG: DTW domain-containing protein [Kangiellaceae bacterium]|nr:DTW domain-containing protein [Kangiellaceae bacterium]
MRLPNFYLLTHSREVQRKTNTGQIAIDYLGDRVIRICWDRVNPDQQLSKKLKQTKMALLHPSGQSLTGEPLTSSLTKNGSLSDDSTISLFEHYLLIDATWQEARKIYNLSPYLHQIPKISLSTNTESRYRLRRNQPTGGLCTVECIINLLFMHKEEQKAKCLERIYLQFNRQY